MMNSNFVELSSNEMQEIDGGIVGFILCCAGVFVVGVGVGYAIGYFCG